MGNYIKNHYCDPNIDSPYGKYLFIELKIEKPLFVLNHPPLKKEQAEYYVRRTIDGLEKTISLESNPERRREIREQIGFASFNYYALEKAYELSSDKGYKFYFIDITTWKRRIRKTTPTTSVRFLLLISFSSRNHLPTDQDQADRP